MDSPHSQPLRASCSLAGRVGRRGNIRFPPGGWRWRLFFFAFASVALARLCDGTLLNKDGYPLPMSFEASNEVLLLFSFLRTTSSVQYAACCCACVALGYISIALKALRRFCEQRLAVAAVVEGRTDEDAFPFLPNLIRGCVAFFNYSWDYMLMLVAMSFNAGVFASLIGGFCLGFLTLGHLLDYTAHLPSKGFRTENGCRCAEQGGSCGCHLQQECTCVKTTPLDSKPLGKTLKVGEPSAEERGTLCEVVLSEQQTSLFEKDSAPASGEGEKGS